MKLERVAPIIQSKKVGKTNELWEKMKEQKYLFLLMAPGIIYFLIFKYGPLYGLMLAFKDFDASAGIIGSPWAGLKYFKRFIEMESVWKVVINTLRISLLKIIFGFPAPIIFALLLNEIRLEKFKKGVQTISYLPHFLSWIVISGLVINILSPSTGLYGYICNILGINAGVPLGDTSTFLWVVIISNIWKEIGYGSIIYLAAISGIGMEMYEAAKIDGANRFKQCLYITFPSLLPTVSIMFILGLGNVLDAGFDQVFNLYTPLVYPVADILDTYIYRVGLGDFQYSFATAVGLTKNIVAFTLVMSCNWVVRKFSDYSIW